MTDTQTTTIHPAWCDPRLCLADEECVIEREHVFQGEDVELSLYDRQGDYVQYVAVFARQRPTDAGPVIGVWSETVGNFEQPSDGFELRLTRAEAIRLWTELGSVIDATA